VEALTKVPTSGSALLVSPATVTDPSPRPVTLRNTSDRAIGWSAAPETTWLTVSPAQGRLEPGGDVAMQLVVGPGAPEGDIRSAVRVTGDDGSTTVVRLATTIDRPPDVAATAEGCTVTAMVEDESEVAAVTLRWLERRPGRDDTSEASARMARGQSGYDARLPTASVPTPWWVEAQDARGNKARTNAQTLPPNCA
jgi:hypothetical protein